MLRVSLLNPYISQFYYEQQDSIVFRYCLYTRGAKQRTVIILSAHISTPDDPAQSVVQVNIAFLVYLFMKHLAYRDFF